MITIAYGSKELITQYHYLNSGHFFDKDAMRFFKSRVTPNYRRLSNNEALFITTEQGPSGKRLATIRQATLVRYNRESDNRECYKIVINTLGVFNKMSFAEAKKSMAKLVV